MNLKDLHKRLIKHIDLDTVDKLISDIQPATIMENKNEKISPHDRDILRAGIISERLN